MDIPAELVQEVIEQGLKEIQKENEEKIYYDYDTKKYATKETIEKAIKEMVRNAREQYDALAIFALTQQVPLCQITDWDVLSHFWDFTNKIITYVTYKELILITEEEKEKLNWNEISWCEPSDLINEDFDWSYYLTNMTELTYILLN